MSINILSRLQASLYTNLTDDVSLMNAINGVFDRVPEATAFPCLAIAGWQEEDIGHIAAGRWRYRFDIHGFSREGGFLELQNISSIVKVILDRKVFSVTDVRTWPIFIRSVEYLREADGITRRMVIRGDWIAEEAL